MDISGKKRERELHGRETLGDGSRRMRALESRRLHVFRFLGLISPALFPTPPFRRTSSRAIFSPRLSNQQHLAHCRLIKPARGGCRLRMKMYRSVLVAKWVMEATVEKRCRQVRLDCRSCSSTQQTKVSY